MKKFRFTFQRAMEWRDRCAEQEKAELERLHAESAQIERSRLTLSSDIDLTSMHMASSSAMSAEELRQAAHFVRVLRAREKGLERQQWESGQRIKAQTQRCVDANRDHKLLEQLQQQQRSRWQYEVDRENEQLATENWLAAHSRKLPL